MCLRVVLRTVWFQQSQGFIVTDLSDGCEGQEGRNCFLNVCTCIKRFVSVFITVFLCTTCASSFFIKNRCFMLWYLPAQTCRVLAPGLPLLCLCSLSFPNSPQIPKISSKYRCNRSINKKARTFGHVLSSFRKL